MSAGCLVIGSATPPVEEVIRDGDNGLLVDFFSPTAEAVDRVLSHRDRMADVRRRARETVIERYDLRGVCLPRHIALVDAVASGRPPPDAGATRVGGPATGRRLSPATAIALPERERQQIGSSHRRTLSRRERVRAKRAGEESRALSGSQDRPAGGILLGMRIVRRVPSVMLPAGSVLPLAARGRAGAPEPPPGADHPRTCPSR